MREQLKVAYVALYEFKMQIKPQRLYIQAVKLLSKYSPPLTLLSDRLMLYEFLSLLQQHNYLKLLELTEEQEAEVSTASVQGEQRLTGKSVVVRKL